MLISDAPIAALPIAAAVPILTLSDVVIPRGRSVSVPDAHGTTVLKFEPLDLADIDYFEFNYGDSTLPKGPALVPGDTILTATIRTSVLQPPAAGVAVAPLVAVGAVISGATAAPLSRVTTQVQPGGTVGAVYLITVTITTAAGRTLERSGQVLVGDL
jgi:hypothetical protein